MQWRIQFIASFFFFNSREKCLCPESCYRTHGSRRTTVKGEKPEGKSLTILLLLEWLTETPHIMSVQISHHGTRKDAMWYDRNTLPERRHSQGFVEPTFHLPFWWGWGLPSLIFPRKCIFGWNLSISFLEALMFNKQTKVTKSEAFAWAAVTPWVMFYKKLRGPGEERGWMRKTVLKTRTRRLQLPRSRSHIQGGRVVLWIVSWS